MYKKRFGKKKKKNAGGEAPVRIQMPREGEVLGLIDQRLGFGKTRVICADKKVRICRVPGKYRRRIWVRVGTFVIVRPWEVQSDERGDLIYSYNKHQEAVLQSRGVLKGFES